MHILRKSVLKNSRITLFVKNDTSYCIDIESLCENKYKMRIDITYNRIGLGCKNILRIEKIKALKVSNVLSLYFQIVTIIRMGIHKIFISN